MQLNQNAAKVGISSLDLFLAKKLQIANSFPWKIQLNELVKYCPGIRFQHFQEGHFIKKMYIFINKQSKLV